MCVLFYFYIYFFFQRGVAFKKLPYRSRRSNFWNLTFLKDGEELNMGEAVI